MNYRDFIYKMEEINTRTSLVDEEISCLKKMYHEINQTTKQEKSSLGAIGMNPAIYGPYLWIAIHKQQQENN